MKLWGGRFQGTADPRMRCFCDSIAFDRRLNTVDVKASIAYADALHRAACITVAERDLMVDGLNRILHEFDVGEFVFAEQDEDIHTAVERRLSELVGPVAGKLHTGRSRNDQVSTDLRLYLLDETRALDAVLTGLLSAIVETAKAHVGVLMPGYTHLQQAQPVLFGHWLMSFFWKFQRDRERLLDAGKRTAVMPLGAGAIAGHPFGLDRQALAAELGFGAVSDNSVDTVSDRDFVVEFLACAALVQVHLSRLAEDLILWSSCEFGFVTLDEAFTTGSSLMPQKRNPDVLELMRAKSGRMTGHLVSMLTVLKGLPSGYNRDLQEDKEALFDALDTLSEELPLATGIIRTLKVNRQRLAAALQESTLSTDLADYLVRRGVPFRESHRLVGLAVKLAEERGVTLSQLEWLEYQRIDSRFGRDLYDVFDFETSVSRRTAVGGTAPSAVEAQIARAQALLQTEGRSAE
jgi:argininosuccinate lyase